MLPDRRGVAVTMLVFIFLSAPAGARVSAFPETVSTHGETDGARNAHPSAVTEGVFVVQLVKELGLRKGAVPRDAAKILSSVRIAPPLGRWLLDQPMTPELTARLRQLTVASANEGWIDIPENQALLAFDTSAAVLGLNIPTPDLPARETQTEEESSLSPEETPAPEAPPAPPDAPFPAEAMPIMPAGDTAEIIYSTYPILAAPPFFTFMAPLPLFYSYYDWFPVSGGFWCSNRFYSGYYVLNGNRFFNNQSGYDNGHRWIGPSPRTISGQVQGRIINRQFQNYPQARTSWNPPPISHRSWVDPASRARSIRSQNPYFSSRSLNKPVVRSQPYSFGTVNRMNSIRHAYPSPAGYGRYASSFGHRPLSLPASHGIFSNSSRQSATLSHNGFSRR